MHNTDLTEIEDRFIFDDKLQGGYRFISAVLGLKGFKTIDEAYAKGYAIVWNEAPFRVFNIKKIDTRQYFWRCSACGHRVKKEKEHGVLDMHLAGVGKRCAGCKKSTWTFYREVDGDGRSF